MVETRKHFSRCKGLGEGEKGEVAKNNVLGSRWDLWQHVGWRCREI
jgi:hypothetical protein